MLYENYEIEISKNNLVTVFTRVSKPLCLLGGWAVYLTVNENYKKDKGGDYHGSKDIDLGFHFSKNESKESLLNSAFNQSIKALEEIGFYSINFRLLQQYDRKTQQALTVEEAKKIPFYDMFNLYVDPIVDNIPNNIHDILGITPIDEKLLGIVFEKGQFIEMEKFGVKIRLPTTEVLLATKLISLPRRTKDHKKLKDIIDIYALIWYSGKELPELKSGVLNLLTQKDVENAFSQIEDSDYQEAANSIRVKLDEMKKTIESFIEKIISKNIDKEKKGIVDEEKWRIPFNIGNEKFISIIKTLYQQQTYYEAISINKLALLTSLRKQTLSPNLLFLKSVGIIAGLHEYKLTTLGRDYAKAHVSNDKKLLESTSIKIIKNSHLKLLSDKLEINEKMDLKGFYKSIKTLGRIGFGSGITGMNAPYASGAVVLLNVFKDAHLIPESMKLGAHVQNKDTSRKLKKQDTKSKKKLSEKIPSSTNETISSLGKLILKDIGTIEINDQDTLEIAERYLNILEKKIQSNASSEPNEESESAE